VITVLVVVFPLDTLYAGTPGGVFRSTDEGVTWTAVNMGLGDQSISALAIDPARSILYAGTESAGVFQYDATRATIELEAGRGTMQVDGKPVPLEAAPVILNARTLVPIRVLIREVGGTVAWEASTRKVTISRKDKVLELWIGKNTARLNGQPAVIDSDAKVVPIIRDGKAFLPLRFVAEALALDVQWDAATRTVRVSYRL
jgi:hypothetical protein